MSELTARLAALENGLRGQATESVAVLDDDGTILFNAVGDAVSVALPAAEASRFHGKTVTHYHTAVTSFSPEDIELAMRYQLREMRAVDDEFIYSMKPPAAGWNETLWRTVMQAVFERIEGEKFGLFFDRLNAGALTQAQFNRELYHAIWIRFAAETGVYYERKPR